MFLMGLEPQSLGRVVQNQLLYRLLYPTIIYSSNPKFWSNGSEHLSVSEKSRRVQYVTLFCVGRMPHYTGLANTELSQCSIDKCRAGICVKDAGSILN
jgi:hypothetical protein